MKMANDKSKNIFLVGPMGAGKTSIGRQLARLLHKSFIDSDLEIEREMGVSLNWLVDIEGMTRFREREAQVISELAKREDIVLSTGGGCVESPRVRQVLPERGIVIYVEVSLPTQLNRLKRDKKRPLLQGGDPQAVLIKLWEEREPYYDEIADFTVSTDSGSVRDVCRQITNWLKK